MRIISGFHSIEEELRAAERNKATEGISLVYATPGPRVKKILETARKLGIPSEEKTMPALSALVSSLPEHAQDHRGVLLLKTLENPETTISFEQHLFNLAKREEAVILVLDSITDPHNVGAIIRSADQFGVDLVILPERRAATDFAIIGRTSAGALSWVPTVTVSNLVTAVEQLKKLGFWVYGADAGGTRIEEARVGKKAVLVMGSEGSGIARLLKATCDAIVSIPTRGKLDSLNVAVAAGILLYEIRRT